MRVYSVGSEHVGDRFLNLENLGENIFGSHAR